MSESRYRYADAVHQADCIGLRPSPQNRRILHLITGLGQGGAEASLLRLLPRQIEAGWRPAVVSLTPLDWYAGAVTDAGADLHTLSIRSPLGFILTMPELRRIGLDFDPAVVHCWMYHSGVLGALAFQSTPLVFAVRHSLAGLKYDSWSTRIAIRVSRTLGRRFDAIVANSFTARREHVEFGFPASTSSVIQNGFDAELMRRDSKLALHVREELGLDPRDVIITNVARYNLTKNQEGLIGAFGLMARQFPSAKLLLAGTGVTWDNGRLREAAEMTGVPKRIFMLGRRTDVPALLSTTDLFVLSTRGSESFPNIVAEAMLCECPVVVTAVGDSPTIAGSDNPVVPPASVTALADAMRDRLSLSARQRDDIGRRNRSSIIERFGLERETRSYLDLYQRLIDRAPDR